jgi:hypothetical protein
MRDPNRKVIYMLWVVIAVLIIGAGIGGFLLVHKADELSQTNTELIGDNDSLRAQLRNAQTSPSPSVEPTASPSASPSPAVSATPTPAASPGAKTPTPNPQR